MKIVDYFMIGATIRIGREILCLPCVEFFSSFHNDISCILLPDMPLCPYWPFPRSSPATIGFPGSWPPVAYKGAGYRSAGQLPVD